MGAERRGHLQLLILLGAMAPGCARVDLGQPVVLAVAADIDGEVRERLADAAESWNLELGTELRVGDDATPGQRVRVGRSDLICAFGGGLTRYAGEVDVQICPPAATFWVLLHELGHVVNIRGHAGAASAAMSVPGSGTFDEEDRALFREANPGFTGKEGCQRIRRLGPSAWPPFLFRSGRGPAAVMPGAEGLGVHLLDGKSALGRERGPTLGDARVSHWAHFLSPAGLGAIWVNESGAHLQIVDGQTLRAGPAVPLETGPLEVNRRVLGGARLLGTDTLLLLIVSAELLELRRYSLVGGRLLDQIAAGGDGSYGELVEAGGRLLLARIPRSLSPDLELVPLDGEGRPQQPVAVRGLKARICEGCPWPYLTGSGEELLIATGAAEGVQITAVSAATLETTRSASLAGPPGTTIPGYLELLSTSRGLVLTVSATRPAYPEAEAFLQLVDPASLKARGGWQRLSQPQGRPDRFPRAVETEEGLIVAWVQGELGTPSSEAIARCVTLE